jgi:hypothetical protein
MFRVMKMAWAMDVNFNSPAFISQTEAALILRGLFDRQNLWESRQDRKAPYRNGNWYTLGSSMYLDLRSKETYPDYLQRLDYWATVMLQNFGPVLDVLYQRLTRLLGKNVIFLRDAGASVSYPGFHIVPGDETLSAFFGKRHKDLQWQQLTNLPDFPFKSEQMKNHFSFTLPLKLPYLGGCLRAYKTPTDFDDIPYTERTLYVHSGQEEHAIAPYHHPVLPFDWRITMQGHGFMVDDTIFIYW